MSDDELVRVWGGLDCVRNTMYGECDGFGKRGVLCEGIGIQELDRGMLGAMGLEGWKEILRLHYNALPT